MSQMDAGPTATDDGQTLRHTPPPPSYVVSDSDTEPDDTTAGVIEVHTEQQLLSVRDIEVCHCDVCFTVLIVCMCSLQLCMLACLPVPLTCCPALP